VEGQGGRDEQHCRDLDGGEQLESPQATVGEPVQHRHEREGGRDPGHTTPAAPTVQGEGGDDRLPDRMSMAGGSSEGTEAA
jgi:hypothetical protein